MSRKPETLSQMIVRKGRLSVTPRGQQAWRNPHLPTPAGAPELSLSPSLRFDLLGISTCRTEEFLTFY